MFGLAEQIGGAQFAIGANVIGNHQCFGRPGKQIDADAAEQLALGFGNKGVAGANKHIDRRHAGGAKRHRTHRLDAAEAPDFIGAGHRLCRNNRRRRPALERRCTGDNARHAGHLGGDDAHMRRCQQWIFATGHITARGIDRDMGVAEHNAGQRFNFDIVHRITLDLGKIAHLRLREFDVFQRLA